MHVGMCTAHAFLWRHMRSMYVRLGGIFLSIFSPNFMHSESALQKQAHILYCAVHCDTRN